MKIARIVIKDILGIDQLDIQPGAFNEIVGANGTGKTSILRAIRACLGAGEEATLLRHGAEKGEAVLYLDDPDGTRLRRSVTAAGGGELAIFKEGVKQKSPTTAIKALTDALTVNPVDFIRARDKDRVNVLLDSLPVQPEEARLTEILGYKAELVPGLNALAQVDRHYDAVYANRRDTNRAQKEREGVINQLSATLPQGEPPPADPAELDAEVARIDRERDTEMAALDQRLDGYRTDHEGKLAKIDEELAELAKKVEEARGRRATQTQWWQNAMGGYANKKASINEKHATARAPVVARITSIRSAVEAHTRAKVTREQIEEHRKAVAELQEDSDKMTATLESLTAYKHELLDNLPIKGLEVVDGKVLRHGVAFETLNAAQQVEIAIELAKLRAKDLGVVCIDGVELMDTAHFEAFREQSLEEDDLQFFVTRVSDSARTIEITD